MIREKRAFTRITLDIPGDLSLYQMDVYHTGSITNISLSGCFFPFDGNLPLGEQCNVSITIGEGLEIEKITIAGIVVRNDSDGAGIKFTDYSPECRLRLEKIISLETAK